MNKWNWIIELCHHSEIIHTTHTHTKPFGINFIILISTSVCRCNPKQYVMPIATTIFFSPLSLNLSLSILYLFECCGCRFINLYAQITDLDHFSAHNVRPQHSMALHWINEYAKINGILSIQRVWCKYERISYPILFRKAGLMSDNSLWRCRLKPPATPASQTASQPIHSFIAFIGWRRTMCRGNCHCSPCPSAAVCAHYSRIDFISITDT